MTKAYYVTRHLKIGNVKGEMYNSEVKAFAQFAELDGKSQAVAVWDEQLTELKYYGDRGLKRPRKTPICTVTKSSCLQLNFEAELYKRGH